MPFNLTSSTFKKGDIIPKNYICDESDGAHEGLLNGGYDITIAFLSRHEND